MIINLTQHPATADQVAAGVTANPPAGWGEVATFDDLDPETVGRQVGEAVNFAIHAARAAGAQTAMIGGALWLMAPLAAGLRKAGVTPVFAASRRESVEETTPDGVVKRAVFRHIGFIPSFDGME